MSHMMDRTGIRAPTDAELQKIQAVLKDLREHFKEWDYGEDDYALIDFAFYEGCGGTDHCGDIIARATPFAVGGVLVREHDFQWVMVPAGNGWHYGVMHKAMSKAIDLEVLEDKSWVRKQYNEPPCPGEATYDSLERIVDHARHCSRSRIKKKR